MKKNQIVITAINKLYFNLNLIHEVLSFIFQPLK